MASSSKDYRFGSSQNNGTSRKSYFARRKSGLAASNKAKRIAKDAKLKSR